MQGSCMTTPIAIQRHPLPMTLVSEIQNRKEGDQESQFKKVLGNLHEMYTFRIYIIKN